jgi:hypothetical protein
MTTRGKASPQAGYRAGWGKRRRETLLTSGWKEYWIVELGRCCYSKRESQYNCDDMRAKRLVTKGSPPIAYLPALCDPIPLSALSGYRTLHNAPCNGLHSR